MGIALWREGKIYIRQKIIINKHNKQHQQGLIVSFDHTINRVEEGGVGGLGGLGGVGEMRVK